MKKLNLTGKANETYDLEKLSTENTRTNKDEKLLVQVWNWNPDGKFPTDIQIPEEEINDHKKSNPPDPKVGQIWLSKRV